MKFKIALWNESKEDWEILSSYNSYDEADRNYDRYSDKYPNAWVEILDPSCC
jgi:hypothetical protein